MSSQSRREKFARYVKVRGWFDDGGGGCCCFSDDSNLVSYKHRCLLALVPILLRLMTRVVSTMRDYS